MELTRIIKKSKTIHHRVTITHNGIDFDFWVDVFKDENYKYVSQWGKLGGIDYSAYRNLKSSEKKKIKKLIKEHFNE